MKNIRSLRTQNSRITISTIQYDIDAGETITISCPGTYFKHKEKHYIRYIEGPEDGSSFADAPGKLTETVITIRDDRAEVTKRGLINTRMLYAPGIRHTASYENPMGKLLMEIHTHRVQITETERMVSIIIHYDLSLNQTFLSRCEMTMKVEKQDDNTCGI